MNSILDRQNEEPEPAWSLRKTLWVIVGIAVLAFLVYRLLFPILYAAV
ncbi:MAG: hypothetical protein KW793_01915 [Candidatus Doudnabacteria bacterium]|nr:hypothetical protein [Candidatus Doudnabacteria bacterium]